ncbi:MAG: DUF5362 family protein [Calditrichota bacterium]|jgi:hypothetical protein
MEQAMVQEQPKEIGILNQIQGVSNNMTGWLKFLGIINIIQGAITIISTIGIGIIIAWLPIWLGILLLQAGSKITAARFSNNQAELITMMDKLRLYFIIQGVLIIVILALAIIGVFVFGSMLSGFLHNFQQY